MKKEKKRKDEEKEKELSALKKLTGIVKVNKKVADEITEKYNGYTYVKKHF